MKKYFHNNQILELDIPENSGYCTSDNFDDRFRNFVPLSDDQVRFLEANKNASVTEVFNCKLNEVPVIPEISVSELRLLAFRSSLTIEYKGVKLSVDEAVLTMNSYLAEDRLSEVTELKALIVTAKNEIRERIK